MAEPANIDTSTPDPAIATGSIERQKSILNDLIATEGQAARSLYERQGPEAQQLLQNRLTDAGQQTDARKAVYDAFIRDQSSAEARHAQTMQRQGQLNSQFMEQAKAAVPIHSKNVDAAIDALRLQFEERQREKAAAASARASASAGSGYSSNPLIRDQQQQDEYVQWALANGKNPDRTAASLSEIEAFGQGGARTDLQALARSLDLDWNSITRDNAHADMAAAQSEIEGMIKGEKKNVSFQQLNSFVSNLAALMELSPVAVQLLVASNASRWGISPQNTITQSRGWGDMYNAYRNNPVDAKQVESMDLGFLQSQAGAPSSTQSASAPKKGRGFAREFVKTLTGF